MPRKLHWGTDIRGLQGTWSTATIAGLLKKYHTRTMKSRTVRQHNIMCWVCLCNSTSGWASKNGVPPGNLYQEAAQQRDVHSASPTGGGTASFRKKALWQGPAWQQQRIIKSSSTSLHRRCLGVWTGGGLRTPRLPPPRQFHTSLLLEVLQELNTTTKNTRTAQKLDVLLLL